MIAGGNGCRLAVLVVVSVVSVVAIVAVVAILTIFLFPAMQGPYPVVHGPATALLAARSAFRLRIAMVEAALRPVGNWLMPLLLISLLTSLQRLLGRSPLLVACWLLLSNERYPSLRLPESNTVLRC